MTSTADSTEIDSIVFRVGTRLLLKTLTYV